MNRVERERMHQLEEEIAYYVRHMADMAPVTAEAVHAYLRRGGKRVEMHEVRDRLRVLVSAGEIERKRTWDGQAGAEMEHYTITALGADRMDGVVPPRQWGGEQ